MTVQKLLIRQAVIAVIVGFVIYLSRGITAGIGYGLAFYASRRRSRSGTEQPEGRHARPTRPRWTTAVTSISTSWPS